MLHWSDESWFFVSVCLDHLGHYLYAVKILFTQLLKEVSKPGISNLNLTSLPLMMWIWHRPGGDHPWEGKDEVDLSMFNVYASLSFASHRDKHPSTAYHCVHRQLSDLQWPVLAGFHVKGQHKSCRMCSLQLEGHSNYWWSLTVENSMFAMVLAQNNDTGFLHKLYWFHSENISSVPQG